MDFDKYSAILTERYVLSPNGQCWLYLNEYVRREKSTKYGYIRVKLNEKWTTLHAHKVAACCRDRVVYPKNIDISHLCHNSTCIRPEHLSAEPHHVNNNRRSCVEKNWCTEHAPYPDCLLNLKQ